MATQTTAAGYSRYIRSVQQFLVFIQGGSSETIGTHADFIGLEIGLLENHLHTVGQGQLGSAIDAVTLFRYDATALRSFRHQRFVADLVFVRFQFHATYLFQQFEYTFPGGAAGLLVVHGCYEYGGILLLGQHLLERLVDCGYRQIGSHLVHCVVLKFNAGDGFGIKEVAYIFLDVAAVFALFAFVEGRFQLLQVVGAGTFIFRLGKAETAGTFQFRQNGLKGCLDAVSLAGSIHAQCFFGLAQEVVTIRAAGTDEGRCGRLAQFVQTCGQHVGSHVKHIFAQHIHHVTLDGVGCSILLEEEHQHRFVNLLVLADVYQRLFVVGDGIIRAFGRIDRCGYVGPGSLDFALNLVHIHIAYDDDSLQIGTIPFVIVVADAVVGEVVNHLQRTDRHTVGILGVGEQRRQRF